MRYGLILIWFFAWGSSEPIALAQPLDFEHANLSFFRDRSGQRQRIENREHWEMRRQQILSGMQEAMGPFPANRSRAYEVTEISRSRLDAVEIRTVSLTVGENTRVVADLYLPDIEREGDRKLPAILALHPTGDPGKRLIGGPSPKPNRQYANELARRGYVVIAPDYPSFGDLKDHDFEEDGHPSGTMQGILNHMRCVDYLQSLEQVDPERIGVIGHSLGGHNAIFAAVFDQRLKAIVASCGWTPFHDYYGGKIAGWTSPRYMPLLETRFELDPNRVPFDFYELVAALAPRPFYSNSPLEDSNFAIQGVRKVIPKARQIYSLYDAAEQLQVVSPPCGHDFPTEIRAEAYRMLDRVLDHQPVAEVGFGGELPRIEPLSPQEALKSFNNPDLQLAAHEPNIHDPIAMSFDEQRRLFVIEMKDYSEQDRDFLGRVRMLQDLDQDGNFEQSTVFADGLSWPTAILCYDGGVFVAAAPDIWFLQDTDGDGRADQKRKILTGFGRGNVQGLVNCLRWGMDNRIHGATSSSGGRVHVVGEPADSAIDLRGGDFSFDPRTYQIRRETGGAQHGMCFDDYGNKYVCSNSDHAQAILFDDRYLARNPHAAFSSPRQSIAVDGGQAPVFRSSPVEPWRIVRTRLRVAGRVPGPVEGGGTAAGYFTGSTGITIYRGDAGSVEKGSAIIGDVGSNIVHRKQIVRQGLDVSAVRIDEQDELITSTDNWFRPVQFGHGPDGCLYILDMYREVIEHPKSLPPMIKQHLDLTEGRDRGRIYRLGSPRLDRENDLDPSMSASELVPFLNHPNSWHRETAARLIHQRQDATCVPVLRNVRVNDFGPVGKIHALWSLHGLKALKYDDLMTSLRDADPEVRRQAVLLAELTNPQWLDRPAFRHLENDSDIRVRWQLAFSLGELPADQRMPTLWRLLRRSSGHPLMLTAIMSSANGLQIELLERLASARDELDAAVWKACVRSLVQQIARRQQNHDRESLSAVVVDLLQQNQSEIAREMLLVIQSVNRDFVRNLLQDERISDWFIDWQRTARETIVDADRPLEEKLSAIEGLVLADDPETRDLLLKLVDVAQPVEVQRAAIRTLGDGSYSEVAPALVDQRSRVGGAAATAITDLLLSKTAWTRTFLEQAEPSDLTAAQVAILSRSSDPEIQRLAKQLASTSETPGFSELMETYRRSLTLLGDPVRGQAIFTQHCSQCHRAGEVGFEIGPNLATMKTRGKEAILANVLAPNREVNPAFVNYLVETRDGRLLTGMIADETTTRMTLRKEKSQEVNIPKSEIAAIKNTGMSLMPTGLEKEISVEQMADLLEFLMHAQ